MGGRRHLYTDRGGELSKSWRPPRSHGGDNLSVPLWEKRFCTDECAIPWGKLCETKRFMSMYKNVVQWDDSAALEAFNNAKGRFWAKYHGQPCDIPLPDPDMYIDEVNHNEYVDPELMADLEKTRHITPTKDDAAPNGWDSFIFTDKPVPATGWEDGEASDLPGQQCSVNWDTYVEQPVQTGGWGAALKSCTDNWDAKVDSLDTWKHNYGWGSEAVQPNSWGRQGDSYHGFDNKGGSYGHWKRRNNESGRRNDRKRNGGGHFVPRAMKPKYHVDGHDDSNNGWRNCGGRNSISYSYEKLSYTK